MAYDLVVRGGTVVDGSGLPRFTTDVGVRAGRIARIGRIHERGAQEIDADGQAVTPGFIDGHTHMDAQVNWDPLGTCSCWHGVTSVVMGNCGFTLAPSRASNRELVVRNLERAEDISRDAMAQGIKWGWETHPEYLDVLDRLPKGINYAAYIGHSALRTWAMGERAFEAEANDDDLALMSTQLRDALKAGAIGFSTSRSDSHETSDDRPVASRLAHWNEIRRLVGEMGKLGVGVFEISPERAQRGADPAKRTEYFARLSALAVETGVPMTFGLKVSGNGSRQSWKDTLALLDTTAAAGGRMIGQTNSRANGVLLSFRTSLPFDRLPEWKDLRKRPLDEQKMVLRDPAARKRLIEIAKNGDYGRAVGPEARKPDWNTLAVFAQPLPPYPTVAEVAAKRGVDPVEAMIDLGLESDFNVFFLQCFPDEEIEGALEILRHPRTVMTFSDTGAHVSQISDCCIHTHLLSYWVRERGDFTLEEGVRMVTMVPASVWGFSDRGMLREGFAADINVFDPAKLTPEMPTVLRDLPGGAQRLVQKSAGIRATIVNGQVLVQDGHHTGALPGRLLRGPLARN